MVGADAWDVWYSKGRVSIWEELHKFRQQDMLIEVEHVKAHRTEKETQQLSLFEKFFTEGNEKADELAKEGAMLDGGVVAQARARTGPAGKRRSVCSFAVCSQFSLLVEVWTECQELEPS